MSNQPETDTDTDRDTGTDTDTGTPDLLIRARDLGLTGDHGRVYGPLDLSITAGGLTVLRGHPGNGRTCLLLTLAGRMRPTEGTLEVCGQTRAQRIFGHAAIAGFDDIDALDPAVSLRTVLTEQLSWMRPFFSIRRRATGEDLRQILEPVFGERHTPQLRTRIGDLTELDLMLLRIALAWSEGPELLVVDDLEQIRVLGERRFVAERLAELGRHATVVVSAVSDLPDGSPAHDLVALPATKEGL